MYEIIEDKRSHTKSYVVGDESGVSKKFIIFQYSTVVTGERITTEFFSLIVHIFTLDGENAAFYQEFFPLGNFDVSIRVF